MADNIQIQLDGTREILDALDALNPRQIINIIKAIERKALRDNIIKPVKAAVPYSSESKKSIRIVQDSQDRTGFFAGVTSDAFWLRFVEKGTNVRTTKNGANRGAIRPQPHAIDTILENVEGVVDVFAKDFGEAVEQELQKRLKKLNK